MTKTNHVGQTVFDQDDLSHYVMQGHDICAWQHVVHTSDVDPVSIAAAITGPHCLDTWQPETPQTVSQEEFDRRCQTHWHMPQSYRDLDIAAWILNQCQSDPELQRCGQELLLYQERGLFDLLRYLKYLVDTMRANNLVWGLGRGSSVASYVLYKLGVHRIDSLYYDLDPHEFLR